MAHEIQFYNFFSLVSFLLPHTSNSIDSSTVGVNLLSPVVFSVSSFTTILLSKGENLPMQSHHCLTQFITFSLNSLKTGPILPFQLPLSPVPQVPCNLSGLTLLCVLAHNDLFIWNPLFFHLWLSKFRWSLYNLPCVFFFFFFWFSNQI